MLGSALGAGVSHNTVALLSFGLFLKPLAAEFGWGRAQISFAVTLATLVIAVGTPLLGHVIDRTGERRVLLPALAAYALAFGTLGLMRGSIWEFYALFIAAAALGVGSNSVVYARLISGWFDERRGLALGLAMVGVAAAGTALPPLTQALIDHVGWRGAYVGLAALILLVLPGIAVLVRSSPRPGPGSGETRAAPPPAGMAVGEALSTRTFWTLGAVFLLVALAIHGCVLHLVPMLTDRGVSPRAAAGAASLFGVGMLGGRVGAGYLMDRLFAPRVAAAFFAAPMLGLALLGTQPGPALAPLSVLLLGLGAGAESDVIAYLTSRYFGLRNFGQIYGYFYAAFMIGTSAGPLAMGIAFEARGDYVAALWAACGAIALLCALLLTLGRYPAAHGSDSVPG